MNVCLDLILPDVVTKIAAIRSNLWNTGDTIRIRFLNRDSLIESKIKQFASEWLQFAHIKFDWVEQGYADIRISINSSGQSWSLIGRASGTFSCDPQTGKVYWGREGSTMNFGWFNARTTDQEFRRTTLHEFGHALGLIHEHQHPTNGITWNKSAAYQYYSRINNWTEADVDRNVFARYSQSQTFSGAYDPKSIMHYPIPTALTLDGFSVGLNGDLSTLDKEYIDEMYPLVNGIYYAKFVVAAENGVFYVGDKDNPGKMYWYKYTGVNGRDGWANESGKVIGRGWNSFKKILAGKDGVIFAIAQSGDLYWYQYLGNNGEEKWATGSGTKISGGWNTFKDVAVGADNNFFAVQENGEMLWYKYTGKNGADSWENGSGKVIGKGWESYLTVLADKSNQLFAWTKNRNLFWYKYQYNNGIGEFTPKSGIEISAGWDWFRGLTAGDAGQIFVINSYGEMKHYNFKTSADGIGYWQPGSARIVGVGW